MNKLIPFIAILSSIFILNACQSNTEKLPILGNHDVVNGDTVFFTIPDFSFTNQNGETVTQAKYEGKIYISDFFFTSCRTICPVMKKEMIRLQDSIANYPNVLLLSHTLDPKHDTPEVLKEYAERLHANLAKWDFVTGTVDAIYDQSEKGYMIAAQQDEALPDGITHSGALVLVDGKRRIRGYYNGTDPEKVNDLIQDLKILLNEK